MIRLTELKLPLSAIPVRTPRAADAPAETDADRAVIAHPVEALAQLVARTLQVTVQDIERLVVFKRSFDARKSDLVVVYIVDVMLSPELEQKALARLHGNPHVLPTPDMQYRLPQALPHDRTGNTESRFTRPVVVGFGPCGMFAALILAQMGLRPIVLERGKTVRERTRDTWGLWRKNTLNPNSNVQFGEGGAGTFSDGKLWSQIKDPHFLGRKVMQEFVAAGAPAEILFEAHPHIGTFKLVKVVENMRENIIALGGELRFEQQVTDLLLEPEQERGQKPSQGRDGSGWQLRGLQILDLSDAAHPRSYTLEATHVVMALGHSARDTFAMLYERGVAMEAKPFSVGFRIEHPQSVIDRARWGRHAGHPMLGAADYKLVHHASNGRSVYSFCMCPGGTVVAATSEEGRVVTNGMSQYSRNERNANAGIVVGIEPTDFADDADSWIQGFGDEQGQRLAAQWLPSKQQNKSRQAHPLSGILLQRALESRAYVLGGSNYQAPAQLVGDFLAQRASKQFGSVIPSYRPGVQLGDLQSSLPDYAIVAVREALPAFGKKIRGFDMPDAVLTGVETRTSSPLRIPRDESMQSINVRGLFPAGEGAGYAGGIMSAGVDGIRVAEAVGRVCAPSGDRKTSGSA